MCHDGSVAVDSSFVFGAIDVRILHGKTALFIIILFF